jgi:hypothetical protein
MSEEPATDPETKTRQQQARDPRESSSPFLARFSGRRQLAPTPRGETTITEAVETSDER